MDIILELFDTFLFDRFYASVLPASNGFQPAFKNATEQSTTPTFSSLRELPTAYQPTTLFGFQPSQFAYMSSWQRDDVYRQGISLFLITWLFGFLVYFAFASLSYYFVFDHATFTHPKFLKNQIKLEIQQTLKSLPGMAVLTAPFFLIEVRGYAKLYQSPSEAPFPLYNWLQFPFFILFTDFFIYGIHRGLHHPRIYKHLHKAHHKWIMPTPFASHAFHPLDGFAQSLPYHIFPFLFPLNKYAYIALFIFINFWTIMIHDGEYVADSPIINGAACHTMHHLYFNFNYGQFTTLWDRMGGSYRKPNAELFSRESKMSKAEWERQVKEMEKLQSTVEGDDDRSYSEEASRIQKKML